jgi:hypothetical protein
LKNQGVVRRDRKTPNKGHARKLRKRGDRQKDAEFNRHQHSKAMQKGSALYRQLAKADLLLIDDFGLALLGDETVRDLLEILDDRYDRCSTLMTT